MHLADIGLLDCKYLQFLAARLQHVFVLALTPMKALTTLLVVGAVTVGTVACSQAKPPSQYDIEADQRIGGLQPQIADTKVKLVDKSETGMLGLEARCAEQAGKTFADLGYKKTELSRYESHYNETLNKCFIRTESQDSYTVPGAIFAYQNVLDAFEVKQLGSYAWRGNKRRKHGEVRPFVCEVTLPSGDKRVCRSNDEFTELVKLYMED
jgi:hypothetical protein